MQPHDLERLCSEVVPGTGAVEVRPLTKGLISETYRVLRDGATYALKAAAPHAAEFGLDLAWEGRLLGRADSMTVAPALVYCDLERAVLISRWVVGRSWSPEEVKRPANVRKMAELLRRVHALSIPPPPRVMSPLSWVEVLGMALLRRIRRPLDTALRTAADTHLQELSRLAPAAGVVCHSDLHTMNLLQEDENLILLDWEYAHVSDPLWDLAGWGSNNDFEEKTQRELLTYYLRAAPCAAEWARLRHLMWLYDYVCLLWSELYLNSRGPRANDILERATQLDARLRLAAHYAA